MSAGELVSEFVAAKAALWEYLSTDENTFLHLDIADCREQEWNGMLDHTLRWGWEEVPTHQDGGYYESPSENDREHLEVRSAVVRDNLTFVWYGIVGGDQGCAWVVFDNDKIRND